MSMDLATLGIRVDSTQVKSADRDLDALAKTGGKAEGTFKQLTGTTGLMGRAMMLLPTLAVGAAFSTAIGKAKEFSNSMAEVSTLVDTATFDMNGLTASILKQATINNSNPYAQSRAAYQIISAGATTAAEATETLTAANKLAVGGVTDVATAADGLTSVMNAYGDKVKSAADVSDAMFIGVKAGKTTIAELSNSLGAVAPLAAQLGVSFDELVASTAALTKGGVKTSVATTGLRAILAAVAKPSDEAAKLAAKLGIEFNSAAIEAKGFSGFLDDLKKKTHGNSDALAILFGGVEALVPVMALTGEAGGFFSDIMVGMGEKTGATGEAFDKIAAGPAFRIGVILSSIGAKAVEGGTAFLNFLNPALGALANLLTGATEPGWALNAVLTALAATAGVLVIRSIVGMTGALVAWLSTMAAGSGAILLFQMNLARYGAGIAIATVATNGFAAAARGVMLLLGGPWGLALAAAAAAIYLIYKYQNQATVASATYTNAQKTLANAQIEVDKVTRNLAGATGQARVEAMAAAKASYQLAMQRVNQAKTALVAAAAERQLTAAMAQKRVEAGMKSTVGAGGGIDRGMVAIQVGNQQKAQADADVKAARENFILAQKQASQLSKAINAPGGVAAPTAPKLDLNTDSPKSGGKGSKDSGKSDAQNEREQAIKSAKQFAESLNEETAAIGKNTIETKMAAAAKAAAVPGIGKLKDEILKSADAWKAATIAEANADFKRDMSDQVDQIKFENSLIGMNTVEREKANIQRAIELKIREAARSGITLDLENIQAETAALLANADAKGNRNKATEDADRVARSMRDVADSVRQATEGFGELFGTAGEGFSNLINTIYDFSATQSELHSQQMRNQQEYAEGNISATDFEYERQRIENEGAQARVANYGNMLGAAKTFFKEGSTGYKILEGAERAYRLFQFAMQIKAIIMDTVQTGASVANSGTRAAASGVEAVAKAMASLPPPLNFIAAGAVIAFLVAMGVKMIGGKGKGGGSGGSGSSSAAKAVESYNGPRDEYGAPTSGYSVLRPGQTNVAGSWSRGGGAGASAAGGVVVGDTTIIVQGSMDSATLPQVEAMLTQNRQDTLQEARRVVSRDIAERSSRQHIGGG